MKIRNVRIQTDFGSLALGIAVASSLAFAALPAVAAEVVTMEIESQGLDLDIGVVIDPAHVEAFGSAGADIKFAYHADRSPHAVAVPTGDGVEMAFVANAGFDSVTSADVANLTFSSEATDLPFSADDCVVIRTDQGAFYKIGNASESGMSVTFNYAAL